jgi:hypothetical protein
MGRLGSVLMMLSAIMDEMIGFCSIIIHRLAQI